MEKRFRILQLIGNVWKILAWIGLIVGFLVSLAMLVTSIFGGEMLRQFGQQWGYGYVDPRVFGLAGGIVTFIVSLVITIIEFLLLYAIGELIHLILAIEENTRLTAQWIQARFAPPAYPVSPSPAPRPVAPPSYPTPAPPPPPDQQP